MEKKFLTDLKVGDTIYMLDDQKVTENGIEELIVDSVDIINDCLVVKCGDETVIDRPISTLDGCETVHYYDIEFNCTYYGTSRESVVRDFNISIDRKLDYYESKLKHIKGVIEKLKSKKLPL